ncbi:MAG: mevalonate kinase [bacterium]
MIQTSAPGKLLLLGDYAVVYNNPCLVTAVDKRLYVEAEIINKEEDEIITPQVKESRFVLETIAHFKEAFSIRSSVRIKTQGDFSHQVGLGSSSAVTVATLEALNQLFKKNLTKKQVFDMCYSVTLLIQGVGSGFDIAAAVYGGTQYYVTGGTVIEPIHTNTLPLIVGYSGIKADTPFYIRKVAEAFKYKQEELKRFFSSITTLVDEARIGLETSDFKKTGTCMSKNHVLLQKLGVSIPKLDEMVQAATDAGAWGAKLSGAGGGDCMIALVSDEKKAVVAQAIENVGGEIIHVGLNAKGVE